MQAKCDEVRKQKELALAAKAKAENDYANARTQQVMRLLSFWGLACDIIRGHGHLNFHYFQEPWPL